MNSIMSLFGNINIAKPTIIYTRCSTKNQSNPYLNTCSNDIQLNKCSDFCNTNKFKIIKSVSEICSARTGNKQKELLNLINSNDNINLVIFDISRFSRNIFEGTELLKKCSDKKITIYSLKENICTNNPNNMKMFYMGLSNAQNESDDLSHRIKESIKFRKMKGIFIPGRIRFGYINNNNKIVKSELEQNIILLILKLKYGDLYNNIVELFKNIIGSKTIKLLELNYNILFGNYNNSDITTILNANKIKYRDELWTDKNVNYICLSNKNYFDNKLLNVHIFIKQIYYGFVSINTLNNLYKKINYTNLDNVTQLYNDISACKKSVDNCVTLLNMINLNFSIWNFDNVLKIIDDDTTINTDDALNYSDNDQDTVNNNVAIKTIVKKRKLQKN